MRGMTYMTDAELIESQLSRVKRESLSNSLGAAKMPLYHSLCPVRTRQQLLAVRVYMHMG